MHKKNYGSNDFAIFLAKISDIIYRISFIIGNSIIVIKDINSAISVINRIGIKCYLGNFSIFSTIINIFVYLVEAGVLSFVLVIILGLLTEVVKKARRKK